MFLCATGISMIGNGSANAQESKTNFDDHVKSIFRQRCGSCHGPDSKNGDLDVTNYTALMQGGSSGTVIEPGDPDGSYLYSLVTHEDEPVMPPGGKIPDTELAVIRKWLEMGALENAGSKAVISKKPTAAAMGENPLVRPDVVALFPRTPLEPVQHTPHGPVVASMTTSPWAPLLAVAGKNQVLLYDTSTLQLTGVLPFPEGSVNVVRFSRSGAVLLAAGGRAGHSGVAVLWDVATGERIQTIGDELDEVLAADISPDHSMVALGGSGRVVNIYSTDTGELKNAIVKHTDWVTSLAFSTDGVLLATGDRNGGLHVWESLTSRAYLTLKGHSDGINSIAWRADSNIIASGSKDATIKGWELNNGALLKSWTAHPGGVQSVVFTRDGRVFSAGVDKVAKLWAADGTQQVVFPAFNDLVNAVAWCDESVRAFAGDYTGEIRVWKPEGGPQLGTLTANPLPLATRLAVAQTQLTEKRKSLDRLTTLSKSADEDAAQIQMRLETATAEQTAAQTAFDSMQTANAAANEKAQRIQTELTTTESNITKLNKAKPLLDQALANLTQAGDLLATDEELKAQVVQLQQRIVNLETQVAELGTVTQSLKASMVEATSQVEATGEQAKTTSQKIKTSAEKVAALSAQISPLIQSRDAAIVDLNAATEAIHVAQSEVDRWQGEVKFMSALRQLEARLSEANVLAKQHRKSLQAATEELKTAQKKTDAVKATVNQAEQSIGAIEAEIRAARKIQ